MAFHRMGLAGATALLAAILTFAPRSAQAVQIIGSHTGNDTVGSVQAVYPDFDYLENVGRQGNASGVYLGNLYAISAAHVSGLDVNDDPNRPSTLHLAGIDYATDAGFAPVRLLNPDNSPTDLVLYKLLPDAGLAAFDNLTIAASSPTLDSEVLMAGWGRHRQEPLYHWNVTEEGWEEVTPPPPSEFSGFKYDASRGLMWGTNQVFDIHPSDDPLELIYDNGFGDVYAFSVVFDEDGGYHEAQAANGDSGGGVFIKNGDVWELAGIMQARTIFEGQPVQSVDGFHTTIFGNHTFIIDLSLYRDQIMAITAIPEPATLLVLVGVAPLMLRRRR